MNDSVKCAAAYEFISFEPLKQVLRTLLPFSLFYFTLSFCFRFFLRFPSSIGLVGLKECGHLPQWAQGQTRFRDILGLRKLSAF